MTSYTRRGALAAMAAGGLYLIIDTDAFGSSEVNRQTDIGARDDGSALLGLSGVDTNEIYTDLPHEIELTNRLEETVEVTLLSRNDRFNFPSQSGSDKTFITVTLTPGVSKNVSVSTDETGTVSEKISFEAVSPTGSRTIELVREIKIKRTSKNPIDDCSDIRDYPRGKGNGNGNSNTINGKITRPNGSVRLKQGVRAEKQIDAGDCVILRSESTGKAKVFAGNNVILRSDARVEDQVGSDDSPIGGSLTIEDQTRIDGKAVITGNITADNDAIIKGGLRAKNGSVELGPGTKIEGQAGSSDNPIGGDLTLKGVSESTGNKAQIDGKAVVTGNITAGNDAIIKGGLRARNGNVVLRPGTKIEGQAGSSDNPIGGNLTLRGVSGSTGNKTQIDGKAIVTGDITTGNDAIVNGLQARNGSVELGPGTKIKDQAGSSDNPIGGNLTLRGVSGSTGNKTRINGKAVVTGDITTGNDAIIKGGLQARNGNVVLGPGTKIEGQAGSSDNPIGGNLTLRGVSGSTGNKTRINGKAVVTGDITTGNDAIIKGGLQARNGSVELGPGTKIEGQAGSSDNPIGGNLTLKSGSVIQGDVYVNGNITNEGTIEGEINPS